MKWTDRIFVNPRKKILKNMGTDEIITFEIQDDPENIIENGTPVNADNLNIIIEKTDKNTDDISKLQDNIDNIVFPLKELIGTTQSPIILDQIVTASIPQQIMILSGVVKRTSTATVTTTVERAIYSILRVSGTITYISYIFAEELHMYEFRNNTIAPTTSLIIKTTYDSGVNYIAEKIGFDLPPKVPTPVADGDAVNKAYVDKAINAILTQINGGS